MTSLEYKHNRRWMCNVRHRDRICPEKLETILKWNSLRKCLEDTRLKCLGYLEKLKRLLGLKNIELQKVSDSFPRGQPRRTWNETIKSDLKERKVIHEKPFIHDSDFILQILQYFVRKKGFFRVLNEVVVLFFHLVLEYKTSYLIAVK